MQLSRWQPIFSKFTASLKSWTMLNMFNTRNFMKLNNGSYKAHSQMKMLKLTQFNSMGFRPSNTLFKKDYYKTLGVDRNSPQADIKKAYFRGAKKLHPDVNKDEGAQGKFAEFNEAYETLRDENKRRIYDSTGMTGDEQAQQGGGPGGPFEGGGFPGGGSFWEQFQGGQRGPGGPGRQGQQGGVNFNDIFGEFEDFFNMGGGGQREPQQSKGRDVVINVNIEFLEAVNGTQKTVKYQKVDNWSRCKGSGAQPGTGETNCGTCGGSGFQTMRQGSMIFQTTWGAWGGAGRSIKNPWLQCQGQGAVQSSATETIKIPKGVDSGVNLRMNGKGNVSKHGPNGDLMIKVNVKEDPYFKRDKYDIHTDRYVTVSEAILGGDTKIKTLTGEIKIDINPGTQHNDRKRLVGAGINKLPPNHRQKGDHYVSFKIEIPKNLNKEQIEAIKKYAEVEKKIQDSF